MCRMNENLERLILCIRKCMIGDLISSYRHGHRCYRNASLKDLAQVRCRRCSAATFAEHDLLRSYAGGATSQYNAGSREGVV
jgi:hypothetical protein